MDKGNLSIRPHFLRAELLRAKSPPCTKPPYSFGARSFNAEDASTSTSPDTGRQKQPQGRCDVACRSNPCRKPFASAWIIRALPEAQKNLPVVRGRRMVSSQLPLLSQRTANTSLSQPTVDRFQAHPAPDDFPPIRPGLCPGESHPITIGLGIRTASGATVGGGGDVTRTGTTGRSTSAATCRWTWLERAAGDELST